MGLLRMDDGGRTDSAPVLIPPLRTDAFRFPLRSSNQASSRLSNEAKQQLYLDALHLENECNRNKLALVRKGKPASIRSMNALKYNAKRLAEHYQVSTRTVKSIIQRGKTSPNINTKMRSGRPIAFSLNHQKHVLNINNKIGGGSVRFLEALLEDNAMTGYHVRYLNQKYRSPSRQSIWRLLQSELLVLKTIRYRPLLTEANQRERREWCEERVLDNFGAIDMNDVDARESFARALETVVDVDEMYLVYSIGNGRLYFFPEDLETLSAKEKFIVQHEWKQNPPKILIFGAVTAPHLLNARTSHLEGAKFDVLKRGIIQIRRIRSVSKYQRKTANHQKGDLKFNDCTVSGPVYEYLMTGQNGLADLLDKYYGVKEDDGIRTSAWGVPIELTENATLETSSKFISAASSKPSRLIRVQQDRAGGHGFNNLNGGKPTEYQLRMVETMRERGYLVYNQPRNSPELNMLDLGFWNSLKKAVRKQSYMIPESIPKSESMIQSKLWEIVKGVIAEYDAGRSRRSCNGVLS